MSARSPRLRLLVLALLGAALVLVVLPLALRPRLERAVRARIEAAAARRGVAVRIDALRAGVWPLLRLSGVEVQKPGQWRLETDDVEVRWWGATLVDLGSIRASGPAGLAIVAEPTRWRLPRGGGATRAELESPVRGLVASMAPTAGGQGLEISAEAVPLGRLVAFSRSGRPLLDAGTTSGVLKAVLASTGSRFDLELHAVSARLPALASGGDDEALGDPSDLDVEVSGTWSGADLDVPRFKVGVYGATVQGSLCLSGLFADPALELSVEVPRVDVARLLRTSGVGAPARLFPAPQGIGESLDLGSASLQATARGRLSDAASFVVTQRLDFSPPRPMPPGVARLEGGFVHEIARRGGGTRTIDVSSTSPDFIALADVPPLFLRTLLLGEDAGFYGHPGIDLREVPAALLTDWARGGAARGASTITQQLAKNLFLSNEKRLGRKLQELSLALLLEKGLGKQRILEIYLNVIEWGPDLYGLRPASRTYFGKEPQQLTPAEMAFLVSLVPGPLKYQSSFAHGTPVPGFRQLVDALLLKLRAVEALSEEDYQSALAEEIRVLGRS